MVATFPYPCIRHARTDECFTDLDYQRHLKKRPAGSPGAILQTLPGTGKSCRSEEESDSLGSRTIYLFKNFSTSARADAGREETHRSAASGS